MRAGALPHSRMLIDTHNYGLTVILKSMVIHLPKATLDWTTEVTSLSTSAGLWYVWSVSLKKVILKNRRSRDGRIKKYTNLIRIVTDEMHPYTFFYSIGCIVPITVPLQGYC